MFQIILIIGTKAELKRNIYEVAKKIAQEKFEPEVTQFLIENNKRNLNKEFNQFSRNLGS